MKISLKWNFLFLLAFLPLLTGASGLKGGGCGVKEEPGSAYTLGGTITGLSGTVLLQNNLSDNLTLTADGDFSFSNLLSEGEAYSVTVLSNPDGQTCTVNNGSGTMGSSDVTDIAIICSANAYTVGGTVSGLIGTVVLQNNDTDDLIITSNGSFTFSIPVAEGATYEIAVITQPLSQTCSVTNGIGAVASSNVTNVSVICSANAYTVGGTVSGLTGAVVLQSNGTDDLIITSNGAFTFPIPVAEGATYEVAVLTQPLSETCSVTNGSGTMGSSNVTNVSVICSTNAYTIGGTVSGLTGTVVLQNNGGDNSSITTNGSFTFSTPVAEGSPYDVTVLTQPSGQTCTVSNGSGTMGASDVTNIGITCSVNATTLSVSVSTLALSVNDTGLNAALTGSPRLMTITNTGSDPATDVTYSPSPALPSGTTISPASCGTIAVSDTCMLTITPGSTPSAASGDTSPTPITLSISGANTNTLTPTLNILTYGSVYQGGYVYSVDDTTPNTGSVGGKVAALTDQATPFSPGIIWSSNGSGGTSNISIYGISETSTTSSPNPDPGAVPQPVAGQTACNGNIDGPCDSNNIYVYYQTTATNAPINTSLYAVGLCKATINGYSDWYLPAICEMGFGTGAPTGCGTSSSSTLQNMQSNLVDNGNIGGLSGFYWSSTEYSGSPANFTWYQSFAPGGSDQGFGGKNNALGTRCSRALDF